jgi:peptidoglycan hydrolase-like protein with peptidoglycan-binding domain
MTPDNTRALPARRGRLLALAALTAMVSLLPVAPAALAHGDKTISTGTSIRVRVETPIRSTTVRVGDDFRARVVSPVLVTNEEAVPAGTMLLGRVIAVNAAKTWGQPSGVTLQLDGLKSPLGVDVDVVGDLSDLNGTAMTTVENLTSGTELMFRVGRSFVVPERFYMNEPGNGGPLPGQGDDVFDTPGTVQQAQSVLRDLGYYSGGIDGRLTPATRAAIQLFQRDQRLRQTGFLDRETIDRLGLLGEGNQEVIGVNVISADAAMHGADQLHVRLSVQTNTGGWQVFEDHFRQRDAMHVYVRGIRPRGPATQAVQSHDLNVVLNRTDFEGLNRIVVHGSGRDIVITREEFSAGGAGSAMTPQEAAALEQQITRMLTDYSRALGVRYIPLTNQIILTRANYRENEVELLFALNSLAATSRLYTQILKATVDPQALQGANDLFVAQANMVDRSLTRTRSGRAAIVARNWDAISGQFERLDNGSTDRDFQNRPDRPDRGYRP